MKTRLNDPEFQEIVYEYTQRDLLNIISATVEAITQLKSNSVEDVSQWVERYCDTYDYGDAIADFIIEKLRTVCQD